jgi:hypothetical protein
MIIQSPDERPGQSAPVPQTPSQETTIMRVQRLFLAALAVCAVAACSDSTGPAPGVGAGDATPQMDGGYLGNGGRSGTDSTSTNATGTATNGAGK